MTDLYCHRCKILAPLEEWRRVSSDGGAGIISTRGIEAAARIYRHDCNWWAVIILRSKTTVPA